jgi:hypothetical protein
MDAETANQIILDIENKILNNVNLGFDPDVLAVLSNPDANESEIELLKSKMGDEILVRLFSIANSAYYGHLKRGTVDTFYKVVSRLGMDFARVLVIFIICRPLKRQGSENYLRKKFCNFHNRGQNSGERIRTEGR